MSTPEERRAFGSRVAQLRKQRGMKQEELAAIVGRTASWLSQVERGVQPVNRLDVLRLLADGLGVSLQALRPEASALAPVPVDEQPNDLDQARLVISGHPAPEVLLADRLPSAPADLPELRTAVERIWELAHGNRFAELSAAVEPLVPLLERAARTAPDNEQPELWQLLSQTYEGLSAAFVRQDEPDAAWVAADRAIRAAEQSGKPLQVFAGIFRLAQAFVRLKRLDQAEHAATTAIDALRDHTGGANPSPEALSLLGSLHQVLALVHARAGNRAAAREETDLARVVGRLLGEDRNDFNLEFGPTNVEVQAVSIAVELGDAGEAIDLGRGIDPSGLSAERRSRLLLDMGRAYSQRRQGGEALACLLQAEELTPEVVRSHVAARNTIRELVLIAGRSASPELKALAERADA
ncbi:transcriptional regulator with XRE-family HTH domain [Kitasatospora sp. MAA4]|uniref:helix-turn-helix domain-containing protein n=1 Tax=Kitasatospora sp. MAA4 TaxID=3035093 RepID=UPI002474E25C|nr:helix-turn-helix transcriptional regulator [Kitasatospora sp. MAA4]MDH6133061.1 transcriptional regulator with XRE-family HTH domain [Kitasatospora sp. MAA4]